MTGHEVIYDTVILSAISLLSYVIKLAFKPSKTEATLIARGLMGLAIFVIGAARRWAQTHHDQIDVLKGDLLTLKKRLKKDTIGLG